MWLWALLLLSINPLFGKESWLQHVLAQNKRQRQVFLKHSSKVVIHFVRQRQWTDTSSTATLLDPPGAVLIQHQSIDTPTCDYIIINSVQSQRCKDGLFFQWWNVEPIRWDSCPVVAPSQLADSLVSQMVVEKMNFVWMPQTTSSVTARVRMQCHQMIGLSKV